MERLTTKEQNNLIECTFCSEKSNCYDNISCNEIEKAIGKLKVYENTDFTPEQVVEMAKELAEYKKLEEQGLLLKLPCKVGDTVWVITRPYNVTGDECDIGSKKEVFEAKCESVTIYKKSIQYRFAVDEGLIGEYFANDSFGKTVFLTKAEAKAKLKEMEGKDAGTETRNNSSKTI